MKISFKWAGQLLLILLTPVLISACSTAQRHADNLQLENAGIEVVSLPASLRGVYAQYYGAKTKYCAEPFPDVALDSIQKLAGKLNAKHPTGAEISAEANVELSAKVVQLAGRSQLVLLARELLYRACELQMNGVITDQDQAVAIYKEVLNLIRDLGRADLAESLDPLTRNIAAENASEVIDKILGDPEQ